MQVPASIEFEGKTLQLWRADQLENLSPENLRRRALDLRDIVGADRVPPLPRHKEGAIKWIMDLQAAVSQLSAEDFGSMPPSQVPEYQGIGQPGQAPTPSRAAPVNYQEEPPTPSRAGSAASSRLPDSIMFEGKSVSLWRFEQLSNISDEKLRTRALDLRDALGADRLPVLPRHRDGAIAWIMNAQSILTQLDPAAFGMPQGVGDVPPPQQSPSSAGGYAAQPPLERRDSDQAYLDARAVREQAQAKNRGSGNPLW
jgi:hypothetical protein